MPREVDQQTQSERPVIVVIEHRALFSSLFRRALEPGFEQFDVLGISGFDEIAAIEERDVRLVLLGVDETLGPEEQAIAIRNIVHAVPKAPVALICQTDAKSYAWTLAEGVSGIICATTTPIEIFIPAVQLLLAGGTYFMTSLLDVRTENSCLALAQAPEATAGHGSGRMCAVLTAREREVLDQICGGSSNKHIARNLGITENTAKMHVRRILAKLHVSTRIEAALLFRSPVE